MADLGEKAAKQLGEITECPICTNTFNDPRMLPCIHTFCFECLKRTAEAAEKKPGDMMPCPLCRKDFIIPENGMNGLQKNFFMVNLLEFKTTLQIGSATIICDMCNLSNEGKTGDIPKATMRCLECQYNYCDSCVKVHQFQKLSRNHEMVKIGSETAPEMKRTFVPVYCTEHPEKALDYYCADCKKIVCVSCFVEGHASHICKDVTKVNKEFRQTIQNESSKVSIYADDMFSLRKKAEIRKAEFLQEMIDTEDAIRKRNQELKEMIDEHTQLLLDELSVIKSKNLKEMETRMQEIDRYDTIFRSFEAYCTGLISKGSPRDICSSFDQLIARAKELEMGHEIVIFRESRLIEVSFQTTDFRRVSQTCNNLLGQLKETTSQFETFAIVVGINDGSIIRKNVININLYRTNNVSIQEQIPPTVHPEVVANVYRNTVYITGLGITNDEIWKYDMTSGWVMCAYLVQGRRRQSTAFIDDVLYICGGFAESKTTVLDSLEAFRAVTDDCNIVGKLVYCVQNSGNCVAFRSSLYIFGGKDKDGKDVNHVQVYNTKQNTCILLTKPMPRPSFLLRTALWETFAILVGQKTCFIFDFKKESWQEREKFKTGVRHFGLVLVNERVFVIGGGDSYTDENGQMIWRCRDDVRYVPVQNILQHKETEWKIHGKLPRPSLVQACGEMPITV